MVNIPYLLYRAWKILIENIDFPLLLITFAIMGVGLATVYSATFDSDHRMLSQAINMGVALLVMWTILSPIFKPKRSAGDFLTTSPITGLKRGL